MIELDYVINDSLERVFQFWIDPDKLRKWWAPPGFRVGAITVDAHVGGRWRIEMISDAGQTLTISGCYSHVAVNDALAFTWAWEGPNGQGPVSEVHVAFVAESASHTHVTIQHTGLPSETLDRHRAGWQFALKQLNETIRGAAVT
jgi:uncharacterized protein YndB with AHSA1/START domain